jgi:hypothetical protein
LVSLVRWFNQLGDVSIEMEGQQYEGTLSHHNNLRK